MTPERYAQLNQLLDRAQERPRSEWPAFLAAECQGDVELAREAERLLTLEHGPDDFLSIPALEASAMDIAIANSDAMRGRVLGHYEVAGHLGGSQADVYLALDRKLDRQVVLKILPSGQRSDASRLSRLRKEARLLSAFNHPNVVTIHDVDEVDGRVFLATEFVAGQSVRARLGSGPIPVDEAVGIAAQIAAALETTHAAGILHRDIKPDNVMVRPDGLVKVLDFGIAKGADEGDRSGADATATGLALGTPGYMSPEQIRAGHIDARSDVFALGVLLYEMVSGTRPFAADTPADGLVATLTSDPKPLQSVNPRVPLALQHLVSKAMQRQPDDRFQSVAEMRGALADLTTKTHHPIAAPAAGPAGGFRWALVGIGVAVLVLAVFGLITGLGQVNRAHLTPRDVVLVGAFTNGTGDDVFDQSLRRALVGQLEQSPFLSLFSDERVRDSMRLMKRAADEPLTRDLAREVSLRNGIKAFVVGAIDGLDSRYLITLEAIEAESGDVIGRTQAEAAGRAEVLDSLRQATVALRARLGETLTSIQRFDPPVDQVTTASLPALKSYALGRDASVRGRPLEAIPLLVRATEIDPSFAVAHAQLAASYFSLGNDQLASESAARAYALRGSLSERESLYITQNYSRLVEGDLEGAIDTLQVWKGLFPRDFVPWNNLASIYQTIGRHEEALVEAREAVRLNPDNALAHTNLFYVLVVLGRWDDARLVIKDATERGRVSSALSEGRRRLAFLEGDTSVGQAAVGESAGTPQEIAALSLDASVAAARGQWQRSAQSSRRGIDLAKRMDAGLAGRYGFEASLRAAAFGRCAEVRDLAKETLALTEQRWFVSGVATALAICGDGPEATRLIDRTVGRHPKDLLVGRVARPFILALGAIEKGQFDEAFALFDTARPYQAGQYAAMWPGYLRGLTHLRRGEAAAAVRELQVLLSRRGLLMMSSHAPPVSVVELVLARAQAAAGDPATARATLVRLLEQWHDADPDLPQLIEARAHLERLR